VRFVHEQGLTDKREIRVETKCGLIVPRLEADGQVTVDMGAPGFGRPRFPSPAIRTPWCSRSTSAARVAISVVSMGNPHAVQVVADVDAAPVAEQGPLIEHTRASRAGSMPASCRWSTATPSACASTSAAPARPWPAAPAPAPPWWPASARPAGVAGARHTRGGDLSIAWGGKADSADPVLMTGPATTVFSAEIELPSNLT
jgi:diaminopimelate epimerase